MVKHITNNALSTVFVDKAFSLQKTINITVDSSLQDFCNNYIS